MAVPTYGSARGQRENAIADAGGPRPEILGTITSGNGDVPPPPWEVGGTLDSGDARAFVEVPSEWVLRWKNPKMIDREGWDYWMKVEPQDSRVKILNPSMIQVDNTIRRGGPTGDILCWMHGSWVESRRALLAKKTRDLEGSARDKREALNEEFKRGKFGPYVHGEASHTTQQVRRDTVDSL